MKTYFGELEIKNEDNHFELEATRLIVRNEEIAFMFSGVDAWGEFRIEGIAMKTELGNFVAANIRLIYPQYVNEDLATIQFDIVKQLDKKNACHVEGRWKQYGDTWSFHGNLEKYNA